MVHKKEYSNFDSLTSLLLYDSSMQVSYKCNRESGEPLEIQNANSLTRLSQLNINNGVAWLLVNLQLRP